MRLSTVLAFLAILAGAPAVQAEVKPHPLFTDNMVLQQGKTCPVWGLAKPLEKIEVTLQGKDGAAGVTSVGTTADRDGNWHVGVLALEPGTGYTLTIKGSNTVTLKNVAIGEVWVCSGQSNMEWSVNASYNPEQVKAASTNPDLRLFTVQKRTSPRPPAPPAYRSRGCRFRCA
jgi:sialate O-acetylesterase